MNVSHYKVLYKLSFSSSNSSLESNQDEENSIISNDSSSIDNKTDKESERNGIDLYAIMNNIDDYGRRIKRNLADIVRVELENLLYSSQ
uniref:Uncharacterized protein n=1 Tax=Panagrolaimus sp. PS1159 TaxID=55785 RepID=A0AC35G7R3_9BILA